MTGLLAPLWFEAGMIQISRAQACCSLQLWSTAGQRLAQTFVAGR